MNRNRGVKGRAVTWHGRTWTVASVGPIFNTLQIRRRLRDGRFTNVFVERDAVKFVRRNYEAKMERALKTDKDFRDFVEIAPCGHRGCGIPCSRWSVDE